MPGILSVALFFLASRDECLAHITSSDAVLSKGLLWKGDLTNVVVSSFFGDLYEIRQELSFPKG